MILARHIARAQNAIATGDARRTWSRCDAKDDENRVDDALQSNGQAAGRWALSH
jgi:hypothetical protein